MGPWDPTGGDLSAKVMDMGCTARDLQGHKNFSISRFNPADADALLLIGDSVISGGEIELTNPNSTCRVGQVIYNDKVPLWDSNTGRVADFTTHFSFVINMAQSVSKHGHGIAFFLAPVGFQVPLNSAGGYLGLFNTTTTDLPRTQIISVEFDTSVDGWDPGYEHVGINNNSITSLVTTPWNATSHSGQPAHVWITYNATSTNLTVFWSYSDGQNSSLSYPINLKDVLPQWVVIGFSSTTGGNVERHILQSWEFSSNLDVKDQSDGNSAKKIGLIVGLSLSACVVIALMVLAFVLLRKRQDGTVGRNNPEGANLTSMNDDLERGAGPRRFSYKQLESATNKFSNERKLGEGGFGGVYKGYLVEQDVPIAVKKFSRKSKQGKKEYLTEVKIISMLRHKNLVQLIGWCHDNSEFLLVYEFMPKGSLDHHLFDKRTSLVWSLRYKIALGLASALLYLHEEWEQCVVHRDIKSSNIMLDSSFNVKLGDFGLARLMDHGIDPKTTGLAGTLGYMAPEYVSSGRASQESDVYSFGVVALEIATGRKAVGPWDEEYAYKGLVGWVWEVYGKGELLSAMDESLQTDFEAKQVECVMMVGLWCAHPDRTLRPSIRQASRVLNFEAHLPTLPHKMPVPVFHAPDDHVPLPLPTSGDPFITNTSINMGR
ncbi:hypothetical protein ACS0TY_006367 [Phlomoides rotata]